jgi:hypothetical protein
MESELHVAPEILELLRKNFSKRKEDKLEKADLQVWLVITRRRSC